MEWKNTKKKGERERREARRKKVGDRKGVS
jgi:hypothetical protein